MFRSLPETASAPGSGRSRNALARGFENLGEMSLWARDQKEIIDHDIVTTSGLQGYLASYQALGVFHYAALVKHSR